MRKMWFGLLLLAVIAAQPALAQNYNKNFLECAQQLGLTQVVPIPGDRLRRWHYNSEAQNIAFMDCVARKAKLAPAPTAKRPRRPSQ
jgi:hypothetical protein